MPRTQGVHRSWKDAIVQCAIQHPLLQTHASLMGIEHLRARPRAITLGIGISSPRALTRGVPFDVLGMLLPAESLRKAADAAHVVALIADRHALKNGFPAPQVARRTREIEATLRAVGRALGMPLELVRASELHGQREYRLLQQRIRARAPSHEHPYVTLEVADTEYLRSAYGSIVKLGWALGGPRAKAVLDERFFDVRHRAWVNSDVGFAYSPAGRTLDERRPHAAPYIVLDPARRLLLRPDEPIEHKLEASGQVSERSKRAVRRHMRRIVTAYSRHVTRLSGPLTERMRSVLGHVFEAAALGFESVPEARAERYS